MNKVIVMGRLTREPDVRYSQKDPSMAIVRYTVAVDRQRRSQNGQNGEQTADFIPCTAIGKSGEFAAKYLHKGTKVLVTGHIQTGSYQKDDGTKVYTTDVVVENQEFAESRNNASAPAQQQAAPAPQQGGQRAQRRQAAPQQQTAPAPAPQQTYQQQAAPAPASAPQDPSYGGYEADFDDFGYADIPDLPFA